MKKLCIFRLQQVQLLLVIKSYFSGPLWSKYVQFRVAKDTSLSVVLCLLFALYVLVFQGKFVPGETGLFSHC